MTKEEAIKRLISYLPKDEPMNAKDREAFFAAKRALEQEPKTGHWIAIDGKSAICSCCNRNNTLYGDFCKWCGTKMVEPQKSEG